MDTILLEGKKYTTRFPNLLQSYLASNARLIDSKRKSETEVKEFSSIAPLVVIGTGIAGGTFLTWALSKEQKEHIIKEYL